MHPTHIPLRLATGAFIVSSGLNKLDATPDEAETMHAAAVEAYPMLGDVTATDFAKARSYGEIALGAALLVPTVSSTVAGAALAAYGAALVGLYLKTPGATQEDGIRPTEEGLPLAKDVWLVGAGLTLATQGVLGAARSAAKSVTKSATSTAKNLADDTTSGIKDVTSTAKNLASDTTASLKDALPF